MGQVYYASIRQYQNQWQQVNRDVKRLKKQVDESKLKKITPNLPLASSLEKASQMSARLQKALGFYQGLANRYFEAGYRYDPAHAESLYIGANMAVQLGNRNLAFKEYTTSSQYFKYALGCYQKIEKELPYFVQLHYWKGVCWKGLGVIAQEKQTSEEANAHFRRALASFDRYELQDPIYKDLFLDRYFCRVRLGERERGMSELVSFLLNIEEAGDPLFRDPKRFDARYILSVLSQGGLEVTSELAQRLYERLMDYHASTCLLPFVPKTDRHIKHSFRLLRE
jgi:tetratricopeptide (TPR) repeat protein